MKKLNSVLIIEDNQDDQLLERRAFLKTGLCKNIHIVNNGKEGLQYLSQLKKEQADLKVNFLSLILVDINMPIMDGFQFLKNFKEDYPEWREVPMVMLSSSISLKDQQMAELLGACGFCNKPLTARNIKGELEKIELLQG